MTPREVHIAVDLGLQKLGSFAYENIKPEFIDYAFNRMGDQYIIERTTSSSPQAQGFEDTVNRLSSVRELVTEFSPIIYEDISIKRQAAVLPYNYFSYVEAQAAVVYACDDSTLTYSITTSPEYIATISFKVSDFGTPPSPPFANTRIYKVISGTPTKIFDFSDFSTGLVDVEEIFTVINKVLDEINRTQSTLKVYWENYRGVFYPNQFVFVTSDNTLAGQSVKIEYTAVLNSTGGFNTSNYNKPVAGTGVNYAEKDTYCRLLSNEDAWHMIAHPFGTTSPDSPILTITNDKITIFINKRFILKGLTLKYIRKPRRMSLPLNQSYEIQDLRALEKIIDMTVEYLSATITAQSYQPLTAENQQRD